MSRLLFAVVVLLCAGGRLETAADVTFVTSDGVRLAASFHQASRSGGPAPAVILLHMMTRSRADWDEVGDRLASAGIHALAVDFRGHGHSARPAVEALDLSTFPLDVQAARAWLLARNDVRSDRLGIAGASVGAHVAVLAAAGDPVVRSLALLSVGTDYRGLRIDGAMRKYGERAALFVASTEDFYASRSLRELSSVGPGLRETRLFTGAGHGTVMLTRERDLPATLVDWFRNTLL